MEPQPTNTPAPRTEPVRLSGVARGDSALVTVVGERRSIGPRDTVRIYHLGKGQRSDEWQEVHCGGGIVFPGPREKVIPDAVCPDCVEARKAARGGRTQSR